MPEAHLESNSGVMESFPGAFPALSLTRVSKTPVEDVERESLPHAHPYKSLRVIRIRKLCESMRFDSWLSARPIEEHGFALHKRAFRDAVALRYGWEPANLPSHCARGVSFDSCHALTRSKGGLTNARHNEIRDLTANLISEVCSDVQIEPKLQPLSGEQFLLVSFLRTTYFVP